MHKLKSKLLKLDRRGYKEYKTLKGEYDFDGFRLMIDHVQGDPFAAPSRVRVRMPFENTRYPKEFFENSVRIIASCDYILRKSYKFLSSISSREGSGKSGIISILKPAHVILAQSAVVYDKRYIEVRFLVGLPAFGRRINAKGAMKIFFEKIPQFINRVLLFKENEYDRLKEHVYLKEDQVFLRNKIDEMGLVSFVANGSVLPRESGVSTKPLKNAIKFKSPEELQVEVHLPHRGIIEGMGIRKGVTLITGGGYHGKSTLLESILEGIYDHVIGDGREYVITVKEAHYVRAEDKRSIKNVDIRPFINNLPLDIDTSSFSTENASGSTSQAANIQEAVEAGARLLLLDEDTSATNFMTRDRRMQELIEKEKEPITPFLDRARELFKEKGISTVLIAGGIGDYLDIADTVIQMDIFEPKDVTKKASEIVSLYPSHRKDETSNTPYGVTDRIPVPESFDPHKGKREFKIDAPRKGIIMFGYNEIDLTRVPEILTREQTRTIGYIILYLLNNGEINGRKCIKYLKDQVDKINLADLSPFNYPLGDFCEVRAEEVIKAINRLRTLKIIQRQ